MTPTARTLAALRAQGYIAATVEKWIPRMKRRVDLFGCIDILAFKADVPGVLGVQATTADHAAERMEKAKAEPRMMSWLVAGMGRRFQVWGWRKVGARGKRKTWKPLVTELFDGALVGLESEGGEPQAPTPVPENPTS
jgi:hypothetical protein